MLKLRRFIDLALVSFKSIVILSRDPNLMQYLYPPKKIALQVIPCEITHSKNESLPNVFILSTQSVHPMRVHNPEYQPPVTSGSRVTGCANFVVYYTFYQWL